MPSYAVGWLRGTSKVNLSRVNFADVDVHLEVPHGD